MKQKKKKLEQMNKTISLTNILDTLLDSSIGYTPPPLLQQHTTEQCYRFINSELYFKRGDVTSTLRALHYNMPPKREVFYNEVRSCRRRLQRDWKTTSVAPILNLADEYPNFVLYSSCLFSPDLLFVFASVFFYKRFTYVWLEFYAMISSIKMRIKSKHMKLLDAFRIFDYNHDGMLSCSELYGGLEWLGMKLTPESIYKKQKNNKNKRRGGEERVANLRNLNHVRYLQNCAVC